MQFVDFTEFFSVAHFFCFFLLILLLLLLRFKNCFDGKHVKKVFVKVAKDVVVMEARCVVKTVVDK